MNETAPLQKQDLQSLAVQLAYIIDLLGDIRAELLWRFRNDPIPPSAESAEKTE